MNPSDFYLQSVLPLERMYREGVFDRGIQYVPVLDGLQQPRYFQWWLSPFTRHKVSVQPCTWPSEKCITHQPLTSCVHCQREGDMAVHPHVLSQYNLAFGALTHGELRHAYTGAVSGRGLGKDQQRAAVLPAHGAVQPVALLALAPGAPLAGWPAPELRCPACQPLC